ncbi:phosphoethanolamine transferase [Volucribacter amazonae]|uniref:Sulfatase N-terminal domain-containing protein n=1 Tax=Volucribacter amazonae TaxID=256731 RepID=A0A9X4PAX4_9PAST|nr:hypothetical protein [Volucribacter amazonae]
MFKPSIYLFLSLVCLYGISHKLLLGSGFYPQPTFMQIISMAILISVFNRTKWLFYGILLPFILINALYSPIGVTFGPPSYQYIASVFATDPQEGKEFFAQIPMKNLLYPLVIIIGLWLYRLFSLKNPFSFYANPYFLAMVILVILWQQAPFRFIQESYQASHKVINELRQLNQLKITSQWGKSTLKPGGYDDYILVIGESARKDYHHAYGYPIENTPFMSQAKGILVDGLTAGGTNTIASLKLMLTKPDKVNHEGNYALNLIDLVKSAGIQTYWLSNHGYFGQFDTPISALANQSDYRFFLKSGDAFSQNTSDFLLLEKFQQLIQDNSPHKRFIVLHLYGSHPISCDRLTDYPKIFAEQDIEAKYFNINCYISSIKKTDDILQQIYQTLQKNEQKNHRTFSMIYFADHGLAHDIQGDNISIHNSSGKSKRHYDVPLFKIASDDKQRQHYYSMKSGLNFTEALANWIGIQNPQLDPHFNLFDNQADPSDYGLQQQIEQINKPDDPAIVIPLKEGKANSYKWKSQ